VWVVYMPSSLLVCFCIEWKSSRRFSGKIVSIYAYSGVVCFITDYVTGGYIFALLIDSINQPTNLLAYSPPHMLTILTVWRCARLAYSLIIPVHWRKIDLNYFSKHSKERLKKVIVMSDRICSCFIINCRRRCAGFDAI
jgi:hypothetical protein